MVDSVDNVVAISDEIWNELEAASVVEAPLGVKPYYNDMIKNEDRSDYKRPMELSAAEYSSIIPKLNWNFSVKYSLCSINMDLIKPIRLCHLLIFTASKLKVFGDDAFGKVTSRCKVAAAVVNYLMEKNRVFFAVASGRQRVPGRVRLINEETFKSAVVDIAKCVADANLQRHYVGDGDGDVEVAGLGLPPSALTDGSIPSAETLFKRSLHEVKGLLESKAYLKNPDSVEAAASRQEAVVLEGINILMAGGEINSPAETSTETRNNERTSRSIDTDRSSNNNDTDRNSTNNNGNNRSRERSSIRASPTASLLTVDDDVSSKRKSPATMMAEASVLAQQAAMKEAENLCSMIAVQKEEMQLRKHNYELQREERKVELSTMKAERETTTKLLSKLVDKLCPDVDPTDLYTSRKRKLDEARAALGEELYNLRLQQLREDFLKSSAM